jgi:hypothetical protein
MPRSESQASLDSAFQWQSYSVRRSQKESLLRFIIDALTKRGCRVIHVSSPRRAPFFIVFETLGGERHGVLIYAFFANAEVTSGRPEDEHRFQIKYGSDLSGVIDLAIDPNDLITTIVVGIDPKRKIFVSVDPLMNTPSPMSRSVEFKSRHVDQVIDEGWVAWERARKPAKTKSRRAYLLAEDVRTEVLIGGVQERFLDLIVLERLARGLDPGERHLVADKLKARPPAVSPERLSHALLHELDVAPEALFDLIEGASRLKMAVRGWVAETHLERQLSQIEGVSDCKRIEAEGQPDISLRWRGGAPILIECKNTLRETYADGRPKVDFQRTRASKSDPCSRYYAPADFPILAACLHAVTESWEFRFALTSELPPHAKCEGRIANMIAVGEPQFTPNPQTVFDKCSHSRY